MTPLTSTGLRTLVVNADAPAGAPLVVAMHGIGATEEDLVPAYRSFAPGAALAFPRSPLGHPPGYAWYRLVRVGVPDPASFEQAQRTLGRWLAALRATTGLAGRPLVLSGFSQGAIMALSYALRHPGEVDGVIAFSGYVPELVSAALPARPEGAAAPRYFITQGRHDPLFAFSRLEETAALIRAQGAPLTVVAHDGGHELPPTALEAAGGWLASPTA